MKVSLLVAIYNSEAYLIDFIKNIQSITYKNLEIVFVNDCSTDGSLSLLESLVLELENVKIVSNEVNMGAGYTKKKCIDISSGEILLFVDSDDKIQSNAICEIVELHEANKNVALIYTDYFVCDSNLEILSVHTTTQINNGLSDFFNFGGEISHLVSFKKSYYNLTIGMNPSLRYAEDFDLYLKLYDVGDVYYYNKPLYYYRQNGKSLTSTIDSRVRARNAHLNVFIDCCNRRNIDIGATINHFFIERKIVKERYVLAELLEPYLNSRIIRFLKYIKLLKIQ